MSDTPFEDLNILLGSERMNEASGKQSYDIPHNGNADEINDRQRKTSTPRHEVENVSPQVAISEVEYIESLKLNDLEDLDSSLKTLVADLDSKDWILACEALNNVRRLARFHGDSMRDILGDVVPLIAKSLKNPRSAVCKTAIMTSADLFSTYSDCIIDFLDPMLVQLLLKSSQDKRFVCEAAEKALIAMVTLIPPVALLSKLQPYLKNKNPRVRAKASICFCRSVAQLGVDGIQAYGVDKLVQIAAPQLRDQLPESRDAARTLLLELQRAHQKSSDPIAAAVAVSVEEEMSGSWEHFCQSKLSPLSAQAVLRATSAACEGLVQGS